jgi:endonuclease/exonuclease/phosphatase family metal-dependent hydrolase
MKLRNKINLLHLSLLFLSCSLTAEKFLLLTWNICGPNAPDADDLFPSIPAEIRMKEIAKLIFAHKIKIVCLQEVSQTLSESGTMLTSTMPPRYRRAAFCNKGQYGGAVIFYDQDVLNCQHYYCFRLNDPAATRDLSGNMLPNKGGGSAACAVLQFKKSGKQIVVCSVHLARGNNRGNSDDFHKNLPFTNEEKGRFQLQSLFDQLFNFLNTKNIDIRNIPLIFAGDFNTFAEEMENLVIGYDFIKALSLAIMPSTLFTVCHLDKTLPVEIRYENPLWAAIDHILYSKSLNLIELYNQYDDEEDDNINRYQAFRKDTRLSIKACPSDHRPIIVEFDTDTTQEQSNNQDESEDPELTKALKESLRVAQPAPAPTRHQAKNKPAHLFGEFWDKLGKEPKDYTKHEWDLWAEYERNWDLEYNQRQPAPAPTRHQAPNVYVPDTENPRYNDWLKMVSNSNAEELIEFHDWLQNQPPAPAPAPARALPKGRINSTLQKCLELTRALYQRK